MCIKWERLRIDCQFIFIFWQKIWGVRYEEVNLVWIFHAVPKNCVRCNNGDSGGSTKKYPLLQGDIYLACPL